MSDDIDIEAIGRRVRAAQRRNLLVKGAAVGLVLLGIVIGTWLQTISYSFRGGFWLGLILGVMAGGFVYKRYEVQVEDVE
ncbi:MAG: hypothetical protein KF901_00350 [Myxococcales bacterium]|nr:hypothetical protein [Myxococcales bacterium]